MPPDTPSTSLSTTAAAVLAACRRRLSVLQQRRADEMSRRPLICASCAETFPDIATYPLCVPCSALVAVAGLRRRRDAELRLPQLESA